VFSHGSGVSTPARYELLFNAWAAAGYVIAAPSYPLSSTSPPGASGDVVNQPADISFLISEMVRLGADPASPYAGLVDGERIAVWRSSSSSP
jgi:predicted dienelactone hydrolase